MLAFSLTFLAVKRIVLTIALSLVSYRLSLLFLMLYLIYSKEIHYY